MLLHNWEHWVFVTTLEQFYLLKKHFSLKVAGFAMSRSLNVFPVNIMYFFWSTVEVCGDLVQSLSWMCNFRTTITFPGFHSVIWVVRHVGFSRQRDWLLFTMGITHIELSAFYIIFFSVSLTSNKLHICKYLMYNLMSWDMCSPLKTSLQ